MNSQARSACYPQSTFYPLSYGPSMQCHRITKTWFPTCSTRRSRSQAPFCLYTLRAIADRAEGTFARLRYSLGGDRPSQTTRLPRSPGRIHSPGLEPQHHKGGISPMAPPNLAARFRSLPPILHIWCRDPMAGCSKGARGLFVLSRVIGILTDTPISPSLRRRQRPDRYAIRAGRNFVFTPRSSRGHRLYLHLIEAS